MQKYLNKGVIKTSKINELYQWTSEGLYWKQGEKFICIANFLPIVSNVYDTKDGRQVVLKITFKSRKTIQKTISVDIINKINWSKLDIQCIVYDDIKNASKYLSQFIRIQAAEYIESIDQIMQYTELGWNRDAYGNDVYVYGNGIIGETKSDIISPDLEKYKLDLCLERQEEMLETFVEILQQAPPEGAILILYFFTGIIKSLYREANVPVDFAFFIYGEQQNRKTTLAKLTNNLYNRSKDMDFSVRTLQMLSEAMADKLISDFKDTTLILDDLAMTKDKQCQQKQERTMEHVVRMLGNKTRKSSNVGNNVKEYYPNANVIFTGEYLPCFPESTLSRMLIMEIKTPVDSRWINRFENERLMLSTVVYSFISWIQKKYDKCVDVVRSNFERYRKSREGYVYQERIQEHNFIMTCTNFFLGRFLENNGFMQEAGLINAQNVRALQEIIGRQIELMEEIKLKGSEKDFCRTFVEYYMEHQHHIAEVGKDKKKPIMQDKHTIYISSSCICEVMRELYKDDFITVQAITKQLKANGFLITDNSKQPKATKKLGNVRYLHISKDAVKEYYKYYCH